METLYPHIVSLLLDLLYLTFKYFQERISYKNEDVPLFNQVVNKTHVRAVTKKY